MLSKHVVLPHRISQRFRLPAYAGAVFPITRVFICHLFAAMYPHLCRIDFGCNNYRMHSDATESSHRGAPSPRAAYLPARGFLNSSDPIKAVEIASCGPEF